MGDNSNTTVEMETILRTIDELPWSHIVFMSGVKPWRGSTSCLVLDPDDENMDDTLEKAMGFSSTASLSVSTIQDIVVNSKAQKPEAVVEDLLKAVNFYYDNDAFINLQ